MIQYLQQRLDGLIDQGIARLTSYPFIGGLVAPALGRVKDAVDGRFGVLIQTLQAAGQNGTYEQEVDVALDFLKGAAQLPSYLFWLSPIVNMLLGQLRDYLIAHKDEFLGKIIVSPSPSA